MKDKEFADLEIHEGLFIAKGKIEKIYMYMCGFCLAVRAGIGLSQA